MRDYDIDFNLNTLVASKFRAVHMIKSRAPRLEVVM